MNVPDFLEVMLKAPPVLQRYVVTREHECTDPMFLDTRDTEQDAKQRAEQLCAEFDAALERTEGDPDQDVLARAGYNNALAEGCDVVVTDLRTGQQWAFTDEWVAL